MGTTKTTIRHRDTAPAWARYLVAAFVYVVILPIVKLLELIGLWPRLMVRALANMMGDIGDYEPTAHDVLICSYFKSGTNWTMQMAVQIAHRGRARYEHIHDLVPWPELPPKRSYTVSTEDDTVQKNSPTGLRVVKTHLPLAKLPQNSSACYICVVRDPKDVFVSSYHFIRSIVLGPLMPSVANWLDIYLSPDTPLGSWAEHLQDGWRSRNEKNVLFLTFEEMKADLPGTIIRMAEFMGVNLTLEELESIVEQASFTHMKSISSKFDVPGGGAPWASGSGAMIRQGQRGRSGELISAPDQQRIDEYWRAQLAALGSDFPYDQAFSSKPTQAC